jgi:hypothetical protein
MISEYKEPKFVAVLYRGSGSHFSKICVEVQAFDLESGSYKPTFATALISTTLIDTLKLNDKFIFKSGGLPRTLEEITPCILDHINFVRTTFWFTRMYYQSKYLSYYLDTAYNCINDCFSQLITTLPCSFQKVKDFINTVITDDYHSRLPYFCFFPAKFSRPWDVIDFLSIYNIKNYFKQYNLSEYFISLVRLCTASVLVTLYKLYKTTFVPNRIEFDLFAERLFPSNINDELTALYKSYIDRLNSGYYWMPGN